MRRSRAAFLFLTMLGGCGDAGSGGSGDAGPLADGDAERPSNVFAWKIAHSDSSGLCRGPHCNRSTAVTGGEIIVNDQEDWVSTLSQEEHARIQVLATSPELAAFLRRGPNVPECVPFTDYFAELEVRTVTHQASGLSAFLSSTTNAYSCFTNANHPAGALVVELEKLRQTHRPAVMAGQALLCVSTNGPWPPGNHHDFSFFGEVRGMVESFDAAPAPLEGSVTTRGTCPAIGTPLQTRTVAMRTETGQRWLVTIGAMTGRPYAEQVLPEVPPLTGKSVHMTLHRETQDLVQGVVLTENGQLLFAMQNSEGVRPLAATYLPGLTVAKGEPVLTDRSTCSARVHSALAFVGDNPVEVRPGREATFTIAGIPYGARTIASHVLESGSCNGKPPGPISWIVWRR